MVSVIPARDTGGRQAPAVSPGHGFRADVQALRAVAVLLVVLYHAGVPGLTGGFIGVDVFFVISGFLITGLLIREQERTGTVSILGFYARRMRRIMPAAALVLIATVVASYHYLGYIRGATIADDAEYAGGFLANFHFGAQGRDYLTAQSDPSTLQHFWSLAVEEQFYVVWPALFLGLALLVTRARSRALMIAPIAVLMAASYAWSIVYTAQSATAAYFSPLTRFCELAAGALLAVLGPELARIGRRVGAALTVVGLAGIVATAFLLTTATAFPGAIVAVPVLATCLVLAGGGAVREGSLHRALAAAPVQQIGLWSYSLYLWHWPLLTIAEQHWGDELTGLHRAGLVVLAVVLAALTYRLVENPVRNAAVLRRRPVLSVLVGVGLILLVIAVAVAELSLHPAVVQSPALGY
ncbi:acyltransferase family protein [Spirilliplanes yamanashiensis]|uniref:Acyltransferase 3 domain-containing protein n=1 Tax=Spirilliplanes yamanashiensis TaxID=42233 RepID=A0A8J3Y9Z8_9ACTN|nr:acyltransferase [Spirilliplanes yamanashiensis]MDP9815684.1 peptidoglycan/LPS O-acetylase OafA/YrhL [Spirilliplanes yamanashiensis]GIJ03938.1 hypothetical protein Sya03_32900 [Spirilliplanes yamanashiensis]